MSNDTIRTEKKVRYTKEQREFDDYEYRERYVPLVNHGLMLASDASRMGIARPEWMGTR